MTKAWHLRQDGRAFPVQVHMYCEGDEDLSSEAEVASFIINSNSKDQDKAEYVLDAWMALLIEQDIKYDSDEESIEELILNALNHLPYKFPYPISNSQLISIHKKLKNYYDVDSYYDFIDSVRENLSSIQEDIKRSMNQQFCRVRYGGQYNSVAGNSEIWFRVSSVDYNWANTIYLFTNSIHRSYRLSHITICRDAESDDSEKEYFYKAKDGTYYKHLPIEEYFEEEHEHNPVFESVDICEGIIYCTRRLLSNGYTYSESINEMKSAGIEYPRDLWKYLLRNEKSRNYVCGG